MARRSWSAHRDLWPTSKARELAEGTTNIRDRVVLGGMGAVPGVGALSNLMGARLASLGRSHGAATLNKAGALANVAGTGCIVYSAFAKDATALKVGLSLLGCSGLAAASAAPGNAVGSARVFLAATGG